MLQMKTLPPVFASHTCVHFTPRSATTFCRQDTPLCNNNQHLRRHHATKFWNSQNFEIKKFLGPLFGVNLGSGGSCPPFRNSLVAWDLTTSDVSTTFPTSFFTVMPKGLTTGPKSRFDWTCLITTSRLLVYDARRPPVRTVSCIRQRKHAEGDKYIAGARVQ